MDMALSLPKPSTNLQGPKAWGTLAMGSHAVQQKLDIGDKNCIVPITKVEEVDMGARYGIARPFQSNLPSIEPWCGIPNSGVLGFVHARHWFHPKPFACWTPDDSQSGQVVQVQLHTPCA